MKLSIAQVKPVKGNIPANMEIHKNFIKLASSLKANAIFFPELSLTGYEPELANELATTPDDTRFNDFQPISDKHKITIGLGIPLSVNTGIQISMLIFIPDGPRLFYAKQQLHADELPYFVSGEQQIILTVENKKIAPAICYESLQLSHADNSKEMGAELYLASVAKSQTGVIKAMAHFPVIAKKYAMPVLMSNCVGYCDNFLSAGTSSVWSKQGDLVGQLDDKKEGLLVFDAATEKVFEHNI